MLILRQVYSENTRLFENPNDPCRMMYIVVTGRLIVRFETYNSTFKRAFCQR